MNLFNYWTACGLLILLTCITNSARGDEPRRLWTTSRVSGSPNPPLPFRVRQTFKHLTLPCPIGVAREPGQSSLLLLHQLSAWGGRGRVVRIVDDPEVKETQLLLDLDVLAYGLAFHPDYVRNGYLFVGSNGPMDSNKKTTRVTRYTVARQAPFAVVPGSAKLIIEWLSDGHNGGDVAFGPDGMLYVTSGDGTSDSDMNLAGQDLTKLTSKVLRIDVDHPEPGRSYGIPKDNPFLERKETCPETWAYGLRNPWRIHIDRPTGDIWVGNNGQDLWEQVYLIQRGANYGWSVMEGGHEFYRNRQAGPEPFAKPIAEHHHSEMRSLSGGVVYRGRAFPELKDAYIYGDWSTGRIWGIRHDKGKVTWHRELAKTPLQITGFGIDSRGELIIADHGGGWFQLERNPAADTASGFPRRLSETGLFESVAENRVQPGLVPYTVNAPLWSDGASKERFIGLPGESRIDFKADNGWDCPNGTVIVKTFSLPVAGKNRRIETRLMTRQDGEWAGYSYAWNEEQSDATLVEAGGLDRAFVIDQGQTSKKKQTWHFPSRAECMVCHSRAANWLLGVSTAQINTARRETPGEHDQLASMERLGVFKVSLLDHWNQQKNDWESSRRALTVLSRGTLRGFSWLQSLGVQPVQWIEQSLSEKPRFISLLPRRPADYPRLVDPADRHESAEKRVRSYLHSNCASCHVWAGGGNSMMELSYGAELEKMNVVRQKPKHDTFNRKDALLVAPGDPERSVLLQRLMRRGPGQMPPLATNVVDEQAIDLVRDWIKGLK
jgi:glucose/arabinose dehydrogenase